MSSLFADDVTPTFDVMVVSTGRTTSIVLQGEADLATLDALRRSLADVDVTGSSAVQLQLAGLRFCDVAALRELAGFARRTRTPQRTVTSFEASASLRKVAHLMGVDDDLDLTEARSLF